MTQLSLTRFLQRFTVLTSKFPVCFHFRCFARLLLNSSSCEKKILFPVLQCLPFPYSFCYFSVFVFLLNLWLSSYNRWLPFCIFHNQFFSHLRLSYRFDFPLFLRNLLPRIMGTPSMMRCDVAYSLEVIEDNHQVQWIIIFLFKKLLRCRSFSKKWLLLN